MTTLTTTRSGKAPALADLPHLAAYTSVLFAGAIFGFFYAWVCSTMWGLDAADPRVAMAAMQAMNDSVRNAVFFPAFFLTPIVLGGTALIVRRAGSGHAAVLFGSAAVIYVVAAMAVTGLVNVPMNEELAAMPIPASISEAALIWQEYSGRWQVYNIIRTVASGVTLVLVAVGLASLGRSRPRA